MIRAQERGGDIERKKDRGMYKRERLSVKREGQSECV